jgi:hypothetical protein
LEQQFKKVSVNVGRQGNSLVVKSIEASVGSVNRSDTTTVETRDVDDGFLLGAYVHYCPSVAFWIILSFPSLLGLLDDPHRFLSYTEKTVQTGIQEVFTRIKNEFMSSEAGKARRQESTDLDQLQKLAQHRDSSVFSEGGFQKKRQRFLDFLLRPLGCLAVRQPSSNPAAGPATTSSGQYGSFLPTLRRSHSHAIAGRWQ